MKPTSSTRALLALLLLPLGACTPEPPAPPLIQASTTGAVRAGLILPHLPAPEATTTPAHGAPDPLAVVTLFNDPLCPGSRAIPRVMASSLTAWRDDVQVHFRHFPVAHPRSRDAAIATQAAHRQGAFACAERELRQADPRHWSHLAREDAAARCGEAGASDPSCAPPDQPPSPDAWIELVLARLVRICDLDAARFERDRRDPEVAAKVDADTAMARTLGAQGTPAVFVNGRRVTPVHFDGRPPSEAFSAVLRQEVVLGRRAVSNGWSREDFLLERMVGHLGEATAAAWVLGD